MVKSYKITNSDIILLELLSFELFPNSPEDIKKLNTAQKIYRTS